MQGSGSFAQDGADDGLDWFQAFTLLKSVGHTGAEIVSFGLDEFKGYLRAAQWLRNLNTDTALNVATISSSAAFSGDKDLFEHINNYRTELRTAHKNV